VGEGKGEENCTRERKPRGREREKEKGREGGREGERER